MTTTNFRGAVENYRQIGNFIISETSYLPNEVLKAHSHSENILSIVLSGGLTELHNNEAFDLKRMDVTYKPANQVHSNKVGKFGAKCLNIELPQKWIEHIKELGIIADHSLHITGYQNSSFFARLKNELKAQDKYSEVLIDGLLTELFAEMLRISELKGKKAEPKWLLEIVNYIESTTDEKISISDLAEIAKVHPVHLINTFKKYYRITPAEFLRQKKIDLICKELCNSNKPLVDIALQFKFSDQSHFNKFFKRYVGVTPSQYMELNKTSG